MSRLRNFLILLLCAISFGAWSAEAGPRRVLLSSYPGWLFPGVSQTQGATDLYFQIGQYYATGQGQISYTSQITSSRASNETCQRSDGSLFYVGSNVPCITDKGLAVWEGRTNLSLQSNSPSTSPWVAGAGFTVTLNNATSPDGTNDAATITATGNSNAFALQGMTFTAATTYTASYYVSAPSGTGTIHLKVEKTDNTDGCSAAFSIASGVITFASQSAQAAGSCQGTASSTLTTNGFYRLVVSGQTAGTSGGILLSWDTNAAVSLVTFCAQVELGSFATPCMPTTTTTAARAADNNPAVTGSALDLASKAGSFTIRAVSNGVNVNGTSPRYISWSGAAHADVNATGAQFANGNVTLSGIAAFGSGTSSGLVRAVYTANPSTIAAVANGGSVASSANPLFGNTGTVTIGDNGTGIRELNGYLLRLTIWPNVVYPSTVMQSLSLSP